MKTVAIDLGGTNIKIGIVADGQLLVQDEGEAHSGKGLGYDLPIIGDVVKENLEKADLKLQDIAGIGMGFPGLVDNQNMSVISTNAKFDDASAIDLRKWSDESFRLPLFLENDARIALLGEWQYGAGRGFNNLVMMTLGTGVGTAAIMDSQLLVGQHFQAGCLGGHFTINVSGAKCTCGNIGCVEAEASTWRLEQQLKEHPQQKESRISEVKFDFENLFRFAAEGDELCKSVRDECLNVWATGIVNLIHAYDPERVIIGGGVMRSADVILPFIRAKVNKHAWTPWGEVEIIPSEIPNLSALLGAHYLVEKGLKN